LGGADEMLAGVPAIVIEPASVCVHVERLGGLLKIRRPSQTQGRSGADLGEL